MRKRTTDNDKLLTEIDDFLTELRLESKVVIHQSHTQKWQSHLSIFYLVCASLFINLNHHDADLYTYIDI
jgi:hypothetical protein